MTITPSMASTIARSISHNGTRKPRELRWDFYHYQPMREENGRIIYFGEDRYYYPGAMRWPS